MSVRRPWLSLLDNNVITFCNTLRNDVGTQIYTYDVSGGSLDIIKSILDPKVEGTKIDNKICVTIIIWKTYWKCTWCAVPFEACHNATM